MSDIKVVIDNKPIKVVINNGRGPQGLTGATGPAGPAGVSLSSVTISHTLDTSLDNGGWESRDVTLTGVTQANYVNAVIQTDYSTIQGLRITLSLVANNKLRLLYEIADGNDNVTIPQISIKIYHF